MKNSCTKHLIGLDLLRFLMAILMVAFHTPSNIQKNFLAYNGWYATSTFFILSGFILTHIYHKQIQNNTFSNYNFLVKRFAALYPIHLITLIIAICLFLVTALLKPDYISLKVYSSTLPGTQANLNSPIYELYVQDILFIVSEHLLMLQAWDSRGLFFNGASWSISALMFFYIFFKLVVKKAITLKKLELHLVGIWVIYMATPLYFIITRDFSSDTIGLIHRNPLLRLPEFIAGILLVFICSKHKNFIIRNKLFLKSIGISGILLCYFIIKFNPYLYYLTHNGLFLYFQIALIAGFAYSSIDNHWIRYWIMRLAKASLTIYMVHILALIVASYIYRITYGFINASSFQEALRIGKSLSFEMNSIGLLIFLIVITIISVILQERVFTPVQNKLSQYMIANQAYFYPAKWKKINK